MVDPEGVLRSARIARAWRSFRGLNYRMTQAWSTNWSIDESRLYTEVKFWRNKAKSGDDSLEVEERKGDRAD